MLQRNSTEAEDAGSGCPNLQLHSAVSQQIVCGHVAAVYRGQNLFLYKLSFHLILTPTSKISYDIQCKSYKVTQVAFLLIKRASVADD